MDPIAQPSELTGLPGAPFTAAQIAVAGGALRAEAGWHIAPEVTETVEVETGRSTVALLPSLHVVDVSAVRNAITGAEVTGWRLIRSRGVLVKGGGWPEAIEVDLTHGYETIPPELLPLLAERMQRTSMGNVRREAILGRSVEYAEASGVDAVATLARYTLPPEA